MATSTPSMAPTVRPPPPPAKRRTRRSGLTWHDARVRADLPTVLAVLALAAALAAAVVAVVRLRARRGIATAMQRATYDVLHTAALAAEPLRVGLTASSAAKAVRPLRT